MSKELKLEIYRTHDQQAVLDWFRAHGCRIEEPHRYSGSLTIIFPAGTTDVELEPLSHCPMFVMTLPDGERVVEFGRPFFYDGYSTLVPLAFGRPKPLPLRLPV